MKTEKVLEIIAQLRREAKSIMKSCDNTDEPFQIGLACGYCDANIDIADMLERLINKEE